MPIRQIETLEITGANGVKLLVQLGESARMIFTVASERDGEHRVGLSFDDTSDLCNWLRTQLRKGQAALAEKEAAKSGAKEEPQGEGGKVITL